MDAPASLLYEVRSDGALFSRNVLAPPWSIRSADAGVRAPPLWVVHGADRCTTADGAEIGEEVLLGLRTCGNGPDGPTVLLTGSHQVGGRVSERLLSALPRVLVARHDGGPGPILDLTALEIGRDDPNAEEAGVSRATFARRFGELVGRPPMAYLTDWRLALAADLLVRTEDTAESIARRVGYRSAFGLSVAFHRVHGTRPGRHRATAAARRAGQEVGATGTGSPWAVGGGR
ncbi:AraC family transcriptional regulator [Streptomyces nojiriensis]|uniref:AraC family transcriptional regulator n=1 Tax=Streptomyces nojiriensis TaxID=66374 RepID=UPI003663873B